MLSWYVMLPASPRLSSSFDVLVFDPEGVPVLAVEVKSAHEHGDAVEQRLRENAKKLGVRYGLVVDLERARFLDLARPDEPTLLTIPTYEILAAYAHGLDPAEVSGQYLELLVDTWLRNIMQPLPADPPPGYSQLASMGLAEQLRDGRKVSDTRRFF
jgi:hypothetical protein